MVDRNMSGHRLNLPRIWNGCVFDPKFQFMRTVGPKAGIKPSPLDRCKQNADCLACPGVHRELSKWDRPKAQIID
jgi:hypothetical protein